MSNLKASAVSAMHRRESLAAADCCDLDLCVHLRAYQRSPIENSAAKSTGGGITRSCPDGFLSHIRFTEFSRALAPAALIGLAINYQILRIGFRGKPHVPPRMDARLFGVVCVVFVSIFCCFIAGLNLACTALGGAAITMVLARRDTHEVLKLVDWHLLIFFAALFIVVDGLSDTGLPDAIYARLEPIFGSNTTTQVWNVTWVSAVGSNLFSNVPFVLIAGKWIAHFADPLLMWKVLALVTTFAVISLSSVRRPTSS